MPDGDLAQQLDRELFALRQTVALQSMLLATLAKDGAFHGITPHDARAIHRLAEMPCPADADRAQWDLFVGLAATIRIHLPQAD